LGLSILSQFPTLVASLNSQANVRADFRPIVRLCLSKQTE
jgi:hypothetical protein